MNKKIFRVSTIIIVASLLFIVYKLVQTVQIKTKLFHLASTLDYTVENHLTKVNRCAIIFSRCGSYLYYQTDLTKEEFSELIEQVSLRQTYLGQTDGNVIFTKMQMGTSIDLSINDTDGLLNREQLPSFQSYQWRFIDDHSDNWMITYYPLSQNPSSIKLDGQPFHSNIVEIVYEISK